MAKAKTSTSASRQSVKAFFSAYAGGDPATIAALLDDEITWTISGPVELLQFCGVRTGKTAVISLLKELAPVFRDRNFALETLVVEGDQAVALNRMSARRVADGRVISFRVAQFFRFRNGKVLGYTSVIDSFDAVEQVTGHRFDVPGEVSGDATVSSGDLVAV